jgi:hypothetical protein
MVLSLSNVAAQAWLSLVGQLLFIILVGANAAFIYVYLRDQYHIITMMAITTLLLAVSTYLHMTLFFRTISVASTPRTPTAPKPAPREKQPLKAAATLHGDPYCDTVIVPEDDMEEALDPSKRGKVWHFKRNLVTPSFWSRAPSGGLQGAVPTARCNSKHPLSGCGTAHA